MNPNLMVFIEKTTDGVYITNLDGYKSIGTHWAALYLTGDNATYFDSFGI